MSLQGFRLPVFEGLKLGGLGFSSEDFAQLVNGFFIFNRLEYHIN